MIFASVSVLMSMFTCDNSDELTHGIGHSETVADKVAVWVDEIAEYL